MEFLGTLIENFILHCLTVLSHLGKVLLCKPAQSIISGNLDHWFTSSIFFFNISTCVTITVIVYIIILTRVITSFVMEEIRACGAWMVNSINTFRILKDYLLYNEHTSLFTLYYKTAGYCNAKKILIGSSVSLIIILVSEFILIVIKHQLQPESLFTSSNNLYVAEFFNPSWTPFLSFFKVFIFVIFLYLISHACFGLYSVYNDYLPGVALVYFFSSIHIVFCLSLAAFLDLLGYL